MAKNSNRNSNTNSNRTAAPISKATDNSAGSTTTPAVAGTTAGTPAGQPVPANTSERQTAAATDQAAQDAQTAQANNNTTPTDTTMPATSDNTNTDANDSDNQQPEVSDSMTRKELDAVGTEAGLVNVARYKDKGVVLAAIDRVRGGEDATAVDKEFAPAVSDKGGNVEVEVAAPFYDLQNDTARRVGDKYKTTETRAAELRGRQLVK